MLIILFHHPCSILFLSFAGICKHLITGWFYFFLILEVLTAIRTALKPLTDHNNEKRLEALFSEIFRQHEHKLYALALRLTKSGQLAKDIIQDVFLKLWENRHHIHTINNMEAWLYRLTENKVIDFLRKAAADIRLRNAILNRLQHMTDESEMYVSAKEYHQIIQKAIDQLPPQRKLIYQLNKENDMNYQQIADELHISKHTVKNQLFTAVQSVRKFLSRNMKMFFFFP